MTLISDIEVTYDTNPRMVTIDAKGWTIRAVYATTQIIYRTAGNPTMAGPFSVWWTDDLGDVWGQTHYYEGDCPVILVQQNSTALQRGLRRVKTWWWRNVTYHWERLIGER